MFCVFVCTEQSSEKKGDAQRGCWLTTTPRGVRFHTVGTTHKHIPATPLLAFKATDPITHEVILLLLVHRLVTSCFQGFTFNLKMSLLKFLYFCRCLSISKFAIVVITRRKTFSTQHVLLCQVMLSREDLVVSVQNPDGSQIVEHADGTRITSLYQDRPPNSLQHTGDLHV